MTQSFKYWSQLTLQIACASILLCVYGCHQQIKTQPKVDSTNIPKVEEKSETESQPPTEEISCPDHAMAKTSIDECKALCDQSATAINAAEDPAHADKLKDLQGQLQHWQDKNNKIVDACQMLLGADGTDVYPEIRKSLNSANRAGKSLQEALNYAGQKQTKASRTALKIAVKYLAQATKILEKKRRAGQP